jgi:hypothetical protein
LHVDDQRRAKSAMQGSRAWKAVAASRSFRLAWAQYNTATENPSDTRCLDPGVVVRSTTMLRGMRYGPGSSRLRPHDGGGSPRNPATVRERKDPAPALRCSPTTIQKWRKRTTTADAAMGPKEPCSTVLTPDQEAIVVAFCRHTLLPLDDCL